MNSIWLNNLLQELYSTTHQLELFKENPAQKLYRRLGYKPIAQDEYLIRMEKLLEAN
ncbi:hypothetical protein [Gloeocapsopsis dulcis]|uniref:hypothetical protein n=1 Tax=Gloeocapsopsis dulcis TaxID=2859516 RepID=UPI0012DA111E|nr:hypothetical protein [Gloeocapsopsis dulcis]WNN87800.1 hypothetical protein P0S91_15950 [Gloeocapsopsis dulcis]